MRIVPLLIAVAAAYGQTDRDRDAVLSRALERLREMSRRLEKYVCIETVERSYFQRVVPRDAPFGFLREGSDAWLDRVALKTGSMDDPHSMLGIAGYLRKRNGGWIAFAVGKSGEFVWPVT